MAKTPLRAFEITSLLHKPVDIVIANLHRYVRVNPNIPNIEMDLIHLVRTLYLGGLTATQLPDAVVREWLRPLMAPQNDGWDDHPMAP